MTLDPVRRAPHSNPAVPGRSLLHPVALAALITLAINDHVLKAAFPNALTGKLSDLAGLVVFPLLLTSILEVAWPRLDRRNVVLASIVVTLVGFTFVKTTTLGAGAFGWTLGIGQWLLTLGPLRAAALAPAAVTVDPTDLIAIPAVLVAAWIVVPPGVTLRPPTARTRPSGAALALLIVAGLATMATSQGAPTASAEFETDLHLTRDAPVVVRHVDLKVTPGQDHIESVTFSASIWERTSPDSNEFVDSSNARLSIVPDATDIAIPVSADFMSPAFDLTLLCKAGCEFGVTLVVRLAPDAPDAVDVNLSASVFASDTYREGDDQSMDTSISLIEDVGARIDGAPQGQLTVATGTIEVGTLHLEERRTIDLTAAGAALDGPLTFPLVGRLSVRVAVESASGNPSAARATVTTRDAEFPTYLDDSQNTVDLDWLAHCVAGKDCTVPVDLEVIYDPSMNAPISDDPDSEAEPTESTPGFVRLTWTIEARLEALDGRTLPADALVLTER